MKRLYNRPVWLPAVLLSLLFMLLLAPGQSRSQTGFDAMDLKTLKERADQLEARVGRNTADYATLKDLATVYHYMAVKDSTAYAKKAVQVLDRAYEKRPEDYELLCYLGNAYVLTAKDGGDGMTRAANTNKGFEYMDKAVRKAPDDITIRLTRGYSAKSSPRFLNRRSVAYDDFEHLATLFEKGLKVPSLSKASVYRTLAGLYKEDGDGAKAQKYQELAEKCEKGA